MKRGRPPMREELRRDILDLLGERQIPYPLTATSVKRFLDSRRVRPCGWHTVRRYLEELVGERLVLRQALPTQAGRKPLVVYMGRYPQNR
jgi:hypothetical protein